MGTVSRQITWSIQRFLCCHPFYNWVEEKCNTMQILVIGDDEYAARFVDLSLQTGQMIDRNLKIIWCVRNEDAKKKYLSKRPELSNYISIDSAVARIDSYASLQFERIDKAVDAFGEECRYVFVATEDTVFNKETAELFKQAGRSDCLAAYSTGSDIEVSFNGASDAPEYIEDESAHERISSDDVLERMAFNTHLVWEGSGNLDYEGVCSRFKEQYNHDASVSFVLSISYKLKSIGVHSNNPYNAAQQLNRILEVAEENVESEEAKILSSLATLEHRRWLIEKITDGAQRLVDKNGNPEYASCLSRKSVKKQDVNGKLIMHPCIVSSSDVTPLKIGEFADHAAWNDMKHKTANLDELDKVSIELHRTMYRAANQVKKNRGELLEKLEQLRYVCWSGDDYLKCNYDRLYFCIENVIDNSYPYSSQFETYERMLIESIRCSGLEGAEEAEKIAENS